MSQAIHIVDAFASEPFTGNPAAVCVLPAFPDDALLQRVAMEMNLAETAFLVQRAKREYDLRWFTPSMEVNLCGHATLAATHVLRETDALGAGESVTYHTQSGELRARALDGMIELDFPALPGAKAAAPEALNALGVEIKACEKNRDNYLVEVADYAALLACAPDFRTLAGMDMQGVIVTTASGIPDGFDFASRYFAPGCGIDEDPVCGSAHCFLAPYWAAKTGKPHFLALQASKRTGVLEVMLQDERVLLAGRAIITLSGQLHAPLPAAIAKGKAA